MARWEGTHDRTRGEVAESQEEDRQLEHRLGWSGAAEMDKVRQLNRGNKHQLVLVVGEALKSQTPNKHLC